MVQVYQIRASFQELEQELGVPETSLLLKNMATYYIHNVCFWMSDRRMAT